MNTLTPEQLQEREHPRKADVRGAYYRDTTAIIHSSAFRRLKHKTQVFFSPSNDHICTRMEHVLHVASIASAICRGLGLDNELAWAIGMGHDLGHTPFGHVGERIISSFMEEDGLGHFEHEVHSLRVVDFLADKGKGLNLTYAVRDGIVTHCGESFIQRLKPQDTVKDLSTITSRDTLVPSTWEAAVVRFSDAIAYLGRDFEDAVRLSIVTKDMLPEQVVRLLGTTNGHIIDTLVTDIITSSSEEQGISFSDEIFEAVETMKRFNYDFIYKSPVLNGYERYFRRLLKLIISYLYELYDSFGMDIAGYGQERNMLAVGFSQHLQDMHDAYMRHDGSTKRLIYDYVAGMTDNFCLDCANEILKPEHLNDRIDGTITGKWFDAR